MVPNTITAYTIFTPGTKAKSSEMNVNLGNHRGDLMPINPSVASAATNTYDLGSTEYNWRRIYLQEPPFIANSQLAKIRIADVYDGSIPPDVVDDQDELTRVGFRSDTETDVKFQFVVPDEYVPGKRIALTIRGYPETTGAAVFYSVARLYRMSITSGVSVPAAVLTGTSTLNNSTAGLFFQDSSLKLTDASGLINAVTVTVGNIITVKLQRATAATADTNTGYIFLTDFVVDLNN